MTASLWLAAVLACAQVEPSAQSVATNGGLDGHIQSESHHPPKPATAKITDVTVYHFRRWSLAR
jgi:hypothetical protein